MTQLAFGTVAPTSRRAVAYIIDALIAGALGVILSIILVIVVTMSGPEGMLGALAIGAPLIWLIMLAWFIVYTLMQSGNGSIGMRIQGLRLAQETDGSPLGFWRTLLRNVIFGLSAAIVIGYFTPLFDGSGRFQGWHDKVAKSVMLDARTSPAASAAPRTQPTQSAEIPPRPQPPIPAAGAPQAAPNPLIPQPALPQPALPQPAAPNFATPQAPSTLQPSAPPIPGLPAAPPGSSGFAQPPAPPSVAKPVATNDDPLIAFVPGITQDTPPVRNAPEASTISAPPAAPDSSVPEATQLRGEAMPAAALRESTDIEDTRISIPGHRLVFTWDDGTRVTVSKRTIFGRNPAPEQGAVVVPVRDETLSLSKTHFEAAAEASGGWVTDRNSTNGTAIVRDGHRIVCTPGEPVRIRLGDAIEIGDRIVTIGGYA